MVLSATVVRATTGDRRVQEESALQHFLLLRLLQGYNNREGGCGSGVAEVLWGLLTPCQLDISIHNVKSSEH